PLRQNIGCQTTMFFRRKEAVTMIAQEQALLKAQMELQQLVAYVQDAALGPEGIDQVERELMRRLLALGHTLLEAFVAEKGNGDVGSNIPAGDGHTLQRLPEAHNRRYVSIFGELMISRIVYGSREGQRIERVPLDERLGLPAGDFSYVLED